jgi:S1-C subfamily serine protease
VLIAAGAGAAAVLIGGVGGMVLWRHASKAQAEGAAVIAAAQGTTRDVAAIVKNAAATSGANPDGPPPAPAFQPGEVAAAPLSTEELVARSLPAVVTVQTRDGTGSGFFVSADTVITNKHVVESHEMVTLRRSAGGSIAARVESSSWDVDLAVLKVSVADPTQPFLELAVPTDVKQGEEVLAIGSPLGLQNSVTRGIVSGVRDVDGISMVQTDAAINPGNSGGPLIDRQGRVIGVNTWKLAGRTLQSLGFSVSVHYVRRMLGQEFALASARELQRQQEMGRYDRAIAALASGANEVEARWKGFRSSCFLDPEATPAIEREWFALADTAGGNFTLHDVPRCKSWRQYFSDSAHRMHDAIAAADARAVTDGVQATQVRRIRRKYNLMWPAWES